MKSARDRFPRLFVSPAWSLSGSSSCSVAVGAGLPGFRGATRPTIYNREMRSRENAFLKVVATIFADFTSWISNW
jgi:hypothetical protein